MVLVKGLGLVLGYVAEVGHRNPIVHILVLEQPTVSFKRANPGERSSWFRAPRGHKFG